MEINYKIGNFLTYLREDYNLTQKELAQKLNVTDKAVSKWENGRCLPSLANIKLLAEIFNITEDEILNGKINVTKPDGLKFNQQMNKKMKKQFLVNYIIFGVYYLIFVVFIVSVALNAIYHIPNAAIGLPATYVFTSATIIIIVAYLIKLIIKRRLQDVYDLIIVIVPLIISAFFIINLIRRSMPVC